MPVTVTNPFPSLSSLSKIWRRNNKQIPRPGDPMVNQAQMAGMVGPGPGMPPQQAMTTTGTVPGIRPPVQPIFYNPAPVLGSDAPAGAIPLGPMLGSDALAGGMPRQLLTPVVAAPPTGPTTGIPGGPLVYPTPNPQNDYKEMIARLASRAQNRAALYSQVMKPTVANLPPEVQAAYNASIPDVQMNMDAYTDALAGSATVAPQLDQILAQQDAVLKAQQSGAGTGGGFDQILTAMIADAQGKKK